MKKLLCRLLYAFSITLFFIGSSDGIQHLAVRVFAGSAPEKITESTELKDQELQITEALKRIEQAQISSPEYFKRLIKNSDNTLLTSVATNIDDSVGAFSIWVDSSILKGKGVLNASKQGIDSMTVTAKNTALEMGYAAEVAIISKLVSTIIWVCTLLLFGLIFSLTFHTFIHSVLSTLGLKKVAKFFSKILEYLLSVIPFAGVVFWILESLIEAKFGMMTGLDFLILKINSIPDITYLLLYRNNVYTFTDSILVPSLLMSLIALVIFLLARVFYKVIDTHIADEPICPSCNREFD